MPAADDGDGEHDAARRILIAYLVGAAGYAAGLGLSLYVDLPAGVTVVCCLCLLSLVGLRVFRPEGGEVYCSAPT